MICQYCGARLPANAAVCVTCGAEGASEHHRERVGFSARIADPAFVRYIRNSNRWAAIFATISAVVAVVGFFIYGETGNEMENPEALFIGLGVGGMFLLIALGQVMGRARDTTWDGTVIDKKAEQKSRKRHTTDDDFYWEKYTEYTVVVRSDAGRRDQMRRDNDSQLFDYYRLGERVRHHKGLSFYEKYDKSGDSIIICNACGTMNSIEDDVCFRCKCPLLK